MENQTKHLEQLGFSRYEAKAYIALLRSNPQNGYELAKSSGIPRANIYGVLRKLEARGAVLRLDTPSGSRYAPVPISELIERQELRFKEILAETRESLKQVTSEPIDEFVWNTHGYTAMLEHVRSLLHQTREQLQLTVWVPEAAALQETLNELAARNVEILTLCLSACPAETCGYCRGNIYRHAAVPPRATRWLVAVSDKKELLVSEIGSDDRALTIRTRQPLMVDLARSNMRNSIALAALVRDLGQGLEGMLQPETRETLATIAPEGFGADWLAQMRALQQTQSDGK